MDSGYCNTRSISGLPPARDFAAEGGGVGKRERRDVNLDRAIQGISQITSALQNLLGKINEGDRNLEKNIGESPPRCTPPLRQIIEDSPVYICNTTEQSLNLIKEIEDALF
jgi:hypothetical protein